MFRLVLQISSAFTDITSIFANKNVVDGRKPSKVKIINQSKPDEIYNLAAQSHVGVSFDVAEYTAEVDGVGTLRILDAIRTCGLEKKIKFYQASTSEMYGKVAETPQNEKTPFHPRSPYGCAKLYSYWITVNYREAYGMFAINGILFNHESPRRGFNFVTKKITRGVAKIQLGLQVGTSSSKVTPLNDVINFRNIWFWETWTLNATGVMHVIMFLECI